MNPFIVHQAFKRVFYSYADKEKEKLRQDFKGSKTAFNKSLKEFNNKNKDELKRLYDKYKDVLKTSFKERKNDPSKLDQLINYLVDEFEQDYKPYDSVEVSKKLEPPPEWYYLRDIILENAYLFNKEDEIVFDLWQLNSGEETFIYKTFSSEYRLWYAQTEDKCRSTNGESEEAYNSSPVPVFRLIKVEQNAEKKFNTYVFEFDAGLIKEEPIAPEEPKKEPIKETDLKSKELELKSKELDIKSKELDVKSKELDVQLLKEFNESKKLLLEEYKMELLSKDEYLSELNILKQRFLNEK